MKNINTTHTLVFCSLLLVSTLSFAERGYSNHDGHSSYRDHSHSQKHYKHQRHASVITPRKWNKPAATLGDRSTRQHRYAQKQHSQHNKKRYGHSKHYRSNHNQQHHSHTNHYAKNKRYNSNHYYSPKQYAYTNRQVRYINNYYTKQQPRYVSRSTYRNSPGLNLYLKF